MSVTKNAVATTAKVVEESLRCHVFLRNGSIMSLAANKIARDAFTLTALAWYDLFPADTTQTPRWMKPWLQAIVTTDLTIIVKTFKLSGETLIEWGSSCFNYDTFKQYLKACGCQANLVSPAKSMIDEWALYRDPIILARLRTAFAFITRLTLPGLTDLVTEAAERYVDTDSSLQTEFTSLEADVIREWFPALSIGYLYDNWFPKHGPGRTADAGRVQLDKYNSFKTDSMVRRLDLLLGGNTLPFVPSEKLDRTAEVVFVPKAVDKLRTICMETATLQWYQQGFASSIIQYVEEHAYLRRRIDLRNQDKSRELAYQGSLDGSFATIDLSDASDRVPWALIKAWMKDSALLPICWMTRSRRATVKTKGCIDQNKYAPMGSALCFPIECIVFCSIVEASIKAVGGCARSSSYRVYGDDIIVEHRYANEVIRRLELNGFKVNTTKSFYRRETHNFRESCGGEYFDGVDVTPKRLSRKFAGLTHGSVVNASSIAALVDLCNTSYSVLPTVRRYVIWDLLKLPQTLRPVFDSHGEVGIFSPTPTNYHLRKPVYNADYQQWYYVHGGTSEGRDALRGDEVLGLFEHLRSIRNRKTLVDASDRVIVALDRKPHVKWVKMKTPLYKVTTQ